MDDLLEQLRSPLAWVVKKLVLRVTAQLRHPLVRVVKVLGYAAVSRDAAAGLWLVEIEYPLTRKVFVGRELTDVLVEQPIAPSLLQLGWRMFPLHVFLLNIQIFSLCAFLSLLCAVLP